MVKAVKNVAVKRIRYKSDNGCVFSAYILDDKGERTEEKINVLLSGKVADEGFRLYEGQQFKIEGRDHGEWINKRTGEIENQFKVKKIVEMQPRGKNFISYIAFNDAFVNVGLRTATALYEEFGSDIYKILDEERISALLSVQGVTEDKADALIKGWIKEHKGKLVEWLDIYGLPVWLGRKLSAFYDNDAITKLESDPYRLIAFSVSWNKVDKIAQNHFGLRDDDPRRLHAAVTEALFSAYANSGNTALTATDLADSVAKLIGVMNTPKALKCTYKNGGFVMLNENLYQSRGALLQERFIAQTISSRCKHQKRLNDSTVANVLAAWQVKNYPLTDEQYSAITNAIYRPISIITGGAGVGKTSVLEALLYVLQEMNCNAIQMALAGRAAKRMQEATGHEAITIAGFIGRLDKKHIETATHIIIDECSMVDLYSMVRILRRLKASHKIVLLGDASQLPPIGAGRVFHALTDEARIPLTRLTKVWRQDETSGIPVISQSVRDGDWYDLPLYQGKGSGVSILPSCKTNILDALTRVFHQLGGANAENDVKIICPTTVDAGWGTLGINRRLSERYTNIEDEVFMGVRNMTPQPTGFKINDVVIATRNNWNKNIMNGSLGRIRRLATEDEVNTATKNLQPSPVMSVCFDTGDVMIDEEDISTLEWGYAITCHKAQGSQFKRVIVPIVTKTLLDRTWIYTALTRGVEQVVFVGDVNIIRKTVTATPAISSRTTGLSHHLNKIWSQKH
jgi:exodeoxyribonuclease V alpha subunit